MAKNDTIDKIVDSILAAAIGSATENAEEKKEEKTPNARKTAFELAHPLHEAYLGFQDAGFTPEQAFQLLLAMND